jgi:hypothetical protein
MVYILGGFLGFGILTIIGANLAAREIAKDPEYYCRLIKKVESLCTPHWIKKRREDRRCEEMAKWRAEKLRYEMEQMRIRRAWQEEKGESDLWIERNPDDDPERMYKDIENYIRETTRLSREREYQEWLNTVDYEMPRQRQYRQWLNTVEENMPKHKELTEIKQCLLERILRRSTQIEVKLPNGETVMVDKLITRPTGVPSGIPLRLKEKLSEELGVGAGEGTCEGAGEGAGTSGGGEKALEMLQDCVDWASNVPVDLNTVMLLWDLFSV